jgi:hypothetical protein
VWHSRGGLERSGDGGADGVSGAFRNGRSAAWQREKGRGRGGLRPRECHTARGGVVALGPNRRAAPGSGALGRCVSRAHCWPETERGDGQVGHNTVSGGGAVDR